MKNTEKTDRQLYVTNRKEWRRWLMKNHKKENEIWLIYYKKHTEKPRIPYDDAVEEALCFGWIDSTVKRVDDETYMQKFTPRKDKSIWSELNKKRARKMIDSGRMTEAGLLKVNEAKRNGMWKESTPIFNTMEHYKIKGKVHIFSQKGGWIYIKVPTRITKELLHRADRGLIPIEATVGRTSWNTSLMPMGDGTHFIALNAKVRNKENIEVGMTISVLFELR